MRSKLASPGITEILSAPATRCSASAELLHNLVSKSVSASAALLLVLACPIQTRAQQDIELIEVIATRERAIQFGSNAVTRMFIADQLTNPASLADFVDQSPGVVKTGQNGLFQVFSIRGVAGQRVQTRFNGIPISTERRAGTAAAFIDPWFLQEVDVVRGPASTLYGSGAVGGALLTEAGSFNGFKGNLGYELDATQRNQALRLGADNWSLGLSRRSAGDGQSPEGDPLHTGFEQTSLMFKRRWELESLQLDALVLTSRGEDIGRSNVLFPDIRIADAAETEHDLLQLRFSSKAGWQGQLYLHDYGIRNESLEIGQRFNTVDNSSTDWGIHLASNWRSQNWSGDFGVELDMRDAVEAFETEFDVNSQLQSGQMNLDAQQRSYALYTTVTLDTLRHSIQAGLRHNRIEQDAVANRDVNSDNLTGYLGWQWFISAEWSLSTEFAAAYRMPSLTERYFSGTTGRGTTLGNPDLAVETAPGIDIGIHWRRGQATLDAHWFRQRFEDYIERTVVDTETRGFSNRQQGEVTGIEIEGSQAWGQRWSLNYGLHWLEGESDNGEAIAEVPATIVNVGLRYSAQSWQAGARWSHRFDKTDVALTELPLDTADLLDLSLEYSFSAQSRLALYSKNALNNSYRISADEISTLGNRRIVGLRFSYSLDQI